MEAEKGIEFDSSEDLSDGNRSPLPTLTRPARHPRGHNPKAPTSDDNDDWYPSRSYVSLSHLFLFFCLSWSKAENPDSDFFFFGVALGLG
jgi:hypothetical protein